jgi:hypothetical protein
MERLAQKPLLASAFLRAFEYLYISNLEESWAHFNYLVLVKKRKVTTGSHLSRDLNNSYHMLMV